MEENHNMPERASAEAPHKRRKHYSGKYPKKYEEKYKELQPEKYADTIEHVMDKGSTPAGMHISICVKEIMDFFDIQPGQKGLDCTFGYGGHSREMLTRLQGKGHLVALDVDPIESAKSKERLAAAGFGEDMLSVKLTNFANILEVAEEYGPFDFILADLGVSSMQIDNPERGFSYKVEGPLDLRMDPTKGESGAERLQDMTRTEIIGMLEENADEPYAEKIANAIMNRRKKGIPITTTTELKAAIEEALGKLPESEREEQVKKSCARTFQALRIDINHEFEALYELLSKLPQALKPGGKAAILTFHSGEDRMVKKSFKSYYKEGIYREIADDVIRASKEECRKNGRAKSAKLRWAIKA